MNTSQDVLKQIEADVEQTMKDHGISSEVGFLAENPPEELPKRTGNRERDAYFANIEHIATLLPTHIVQKTVQKTVEETLSVPSWDVADLSWRTQHALMFRVSIVMHAYLQEAYPYSNMEELHKDNRIKPITPKLAVPLHMLYKATGIAPSMSYCLYSHWNYRKKYPARRLDLDNINLLYSFTDSMDEKWFVWIHQVMEERFARAIPYMLRAYFISRLDMAFWDEPRIVYKMYDSLRKAAYYCTECVDVLERMREKCDPNSYFRTVRLFYGLPKNIVYKGVDDPDFKDKPQIILGETGGHAPLKQFWIHLLGITHEEDGYFPRMRKHMSTPHEALVLKMMNARVYDFVLWHRERNNVTLQRAYNMLLTPMIDWDWEHWSQVVSYIQNHGESYGTGKPPLNWLQRLREKRKSYLLY